MKSILHALQLTASISLLAPLAAAEDVSAPYLENFDLIANGALPSNWTPGNSGSPGSGGFANFNVQSGALKVDFLYGTSGASTTARSVGFTSSNVGGTQANDFTFTMDLTNASASAISTGTGTSTFSLFSHFDAVDMGAGTTGKSGFLFNYIVAAGPTAVADVTPSPAGSLTFIRFDSGTATTSSTIASLPFDPAHSYKLTLSGTYAASTGNNLTLAFIVTDVTASTSATLTIPGLPIPISAAQNAFGIRCRPTAATGRTLQGTLDNVSLTLAGSNSVILPVITNFTATPPDTISLTFTSTPGEDYEVTRSTTLADGSFGSPVTVPATGTITTYT
ncbi:MAG: hypothetical protein H8M99_12260, partial [Gloeobacteraceae cyanobacterium ES-bin-144]|nr:hypothetical protein [Verrucomicrobiales bacterium]